MDLWICLDLWNLHLSKATTTSLCHQKNVPVDGMYSSLLLHILQVPIAMMVSNRTDVEKSMVMPLGCSQRSPRTNFVRLLFVPELDIIPVFGGGM